MKVRREDRVVWVTSERGISWPLVAAVDVDRMRFFIEEEEEETLARTHIFTKSS